MNNWYSIAQQPRRLSRREKKLKSRQEQSMRQVMVHYAGNARLCTQAEEQIRTAVAATHTWRPRRPVKVPRRLRPYLGRQVEALSIPSIVALLGVGTMAMYALLRGKYVGQSVVTGDVTAGEGDAPAGT